jgi:type II secretory pathway component PulM
MEISGSGGLLLLVIAVLWLGFMTPSTKRSESSSKKKRKRIETSSTFSQAGKTIAVQARTSQNPWIHAEVAGVAQAAEVKETSAEKISVNRLPDPLSARLGKIENVKWAEVREIKEAREVKENLSSKTLDEILERRRSNG